MDDIGEFLITVADDQVERDPLSEPRWPILQALAWIVWRDLDGLRLTAKAKSIADFNAEAILVEVARRLVRVIPPHNVPVLSSQVGTIEVMGHNVVDEAKIVDIARAAFAELRRLIDPGIVEIIGIPCDGLHPRRITPIDWAYLESIADHNGAAHLCRADGTSVFKCVTIKSRAVCDLWTELPKIGAEILRTLADNHADTARTIEQYREKIQGALDRFSESIPPGESDELDLAIAEPEPRESHRTPTHATTSARYKAIREALQSFDSNSGKTGKKRLAHVNKVLATKTNANGQRFASVSLTTMRRATGDKQS